MMSAPLPLDEFDRLHMLRDIDLLDSEPDPVLDEIVACAATITGCPIALLSLVDAKRAWFKSRMGTHLSEAPRALAFCAYVILGEDLFEVEDAGADRRFHDNPAVVGDAGVRYYAGVPVLAGGYAVGSLCVMDHRPRRLDDRERAAMRRLARTVSNWLGQNYLHGGAGEAAPAVRFRAAAPVTVSTNRFGGFHLALRN
jgi:GAF domain-containing protein